MINEFNKKCCQNCAHYVHYYTINNARLKKHCKGHCSNHNIKWWLKQKGDLCEKWINDKSVQEKYSESIRFIIERIAKTLEELTLILSSEQND